MKSRITAIGAVVLMVLFPLALCCSFAEQHECCRDRCKMAPEPAPVVAIAPFVAVLTAPAIVTVAAEQPLEQYDSTPVPHLFLPITTVQLRI